MIQMSLMFEETKQMLGTPEDLRACLGSTLAIDTETTGLSWWKDRVLGICLYCPSKNIKKYVLANQPGAIEAVQDLAQDPATTVYMHNAKFDCEFLKIKITSAKWRLRDTILMAHLLDSRLKKDLGSLELRILKTETKKKYKPSKMKDLANQPLDLVATYGINDARITLELGEKMWPALAKWSLENLYAKQLRYLGVLQAMEERGVLVDRNFLIEGHDYLSKILDQLTPKLYEKTKRVFNFRSPQQMASAIFEGMGILRPRDFDKELERSEITGTDYLIDRLKHPLGRLILQIRETDKLLSTITEWLGLLDNQNILHASFNLTGTRTGRLSSSRPNLQNIVANTRMRASEDGKRDVREKFYNLRNGLIARPGFLLCGGDYSQQELRLFGILAQEPKILAAMKGGEDLHTQIAKLVWKDMIDADPNNLALCRLWSKHLSFGGPKNHAELKSAQLLEPKGISSQILGKPGTMVQRLTDLPAVEDVCDAQA